MSADEADRQGKAEDARRLPISAFLITRDEAARLPATLAALDFAEQVVVVDSGSTDATPEIARAAGAEVHFRAWEGYGPQKAHAEGLCRHDWLFNVDADEVATPQLAAAIRRRFAAGPPPPGAFLIDILNVYPGEVRPRWLARDYRVVRLYHRRVGRYRAHALFDRVVLEEGWRPQRLEGALWHYPLLSWAHFVEKENRYTSFQAHSAGRRSRMSLLFRLFVEFPLSFFKFYVLRRHLTGGWKGFAFATVAAFGRFLRLVKMLERNENPDRSMRGGENS